MLRETPAKADALVVLLGDRSPERTRTAYSLFSEGVAPKIVFLSSYRERPWFSFRDVSSAPLSDGGVFYQRRLTSLGVPVDAISKVEYDLAYDTSSELKAVAEYLRAAGHHSVVLVTSASHARRVSIIWQRVASDIAERVVTAPDSGLERWWTSTRCRNLIAYEYGALVKELFRWPGSLLGA
jgi:uncharacterized SAM-binding protein YcdF (DUF218 family)